MNSSTSPFKKRRAPGRSAALILAAALAAWVLGAIYTIRWSPSMRPTVAIGRAKIGWSEKLRATHTNQFIIIGGSSCSFSVDPGHALEKHGAPVANLAVGAGLGVQTLARFGLAQARAGDTVVAAFEPSLLGGKILPLQTGVQFAFAMGHPEWAQDGFDFEKQEPSWLGAISALRPGARHLLTLMAKIAARRPLDRYGQDPILPTGQAETSGPFQYSSANFPPRLSGDGKRFLQSLSDYCQHRGIRIAYLLPWQYVDSTAAATLHSANEKFLEEIRAVLPVLEEPALGVITNRAAMADTVWHLNRDAARLRTDSLLAALRQSPYLLSGER